LFSGGFGGAHDRTKMFASSNAMKVFDTDASKTGDLIFREDFLTRFDGDHRFYTIPHYLKWQRGLSYILYRASSSTLL
jgi:hypothetical protein